jgi:pseudouridine synthase
MKIRLNKFLALAGVASRREADRMISERRVSVNGEVVDVLGTTIDDQADKIEVDGRRIKAFPPLAYMILNKPPGYLVTAKDPFHRPTIMDLLPPLKNRVFPVGRLDFDSEGLLLLTNDGDLAYRLMHPRFQVEKEYLVKVKPRPEPSVLAKLEKGIFLDGKKTAPAQIRMLPKAAKGSAALVVKIHEGRKRELRRMFETLGHRVFALKRLRLGSLHLGKLKKGQWRNLTPEEIRSLKRDVRLL